MTVLIAVFDIGETRRSFPVRGTGRKTLGHSLSPSNAVAKIVWDDFQFGIELGSSYTG